MKHKTQRYDEVHRPLPSDQSACPRACPGAGIGKSGCNRRLTMFPQMKYDPPRFMVAEHFSTLAGGASQAQRSHGLPLSESVRNDLVFDKGNSFLTTVIREWSLVIGELPVAPPNPEPRTLNPEPRTLSFPATAMSSEELVCLPIAQIRLDRGTQVGAKIDEALVELRRSNADKIARSRSCWPIRSGRRSRPAGSPTFAASAGPSSRASEVNWQPLPHTRKRGLRRAFARTASGAAFDALRQKGSTPSTDRCGPRANSAGTIPC